MSPRGAAGDTRRAASSTAVAPESQRRVATGVRSSATTRVGRVVAGSPAGASHTLGSGRVAAKLREAHSRGAVRGIRATAALVAAAALTAACPDPHEPEVHVADTAATHVRTTSIAPPRDRVWHGWGQFSGAWTLGHESGLGDEEDLAAYESLVAPALPAMLSFYVAPVKDQVEPLIAGIARQREERGPFVVQLGLYFYSIQQRVAVGAFDDGVRALARGLRALDLPVLLRVGFEFDDPWERYAPRAYTRAFRRIAGIFRAEGARDVAFVWHASTLGLMAGDPSPWYPGDDYVDWWAVSLFHTEELDSEALKTFLDDARARGFPVLVAEASPVFSSREPGHVRGARSADEALGWYDSLFGLIERRSVIRAVSLIAVDWRRLEADLPGHGWPDARIDAWPGVAARVHDALLDARYVHRAELRDALAHRNGPAS